MYLDPGEREGIFFFQTLSLTYQNCIKNKNFHIKFFFSAGGITMWGEGNSIQKIILFWPYHLVYYQSF